MKKSTFKGVLPIEKYCKVYDFASLVKGSAQSCPNKYSAVAEMGDRLITIYMGLKVEGAVPLSVGGELGPI